jgi:transcriptional regulator with XRE-family HTH domain
MKSTKEGTVLDMTTIQNIGMQIAKLRKENNMTQDELAKKLDVSAQAVSKWENGGAPDLELLPRIADYFGVSIDHLFGRGQIKTESGFTQKAFLERLDAIQKQISENSLFLYNDTIKSLVAFEFEDDEAKKESIDNISATFCAREELQRKLMENYQRMYEQTLISERKQK